MSELNSPASVSAPRGSRLISKVLSPAVHLWLRSQVEQIEGLEVKIQAGDRQILSGYLPQVEVKAEHLVYQGLHLSHLQLRAESIRINLGQVLRGKPLQLLEPVPINLELKVPEKDLNASLGSALMGVAVADLLHRLLAVDADLASLLGHDPQPDQLQNLQVQLQHHQLTLGMSVITTEGKTLPFALRTGLKLASPQQLQFESPQWLTALQSRRGFPLEALEGFLIDFGPDVDFQTLTLEDGELVCRGTIQVMPAVANIESNAESNQGVEVG
jgi:hypothetical protein